MAARLMWGTPNTAAQTVSDAALRRADENDYTMLEPGETAGAPGLPGGGSGGDADMPIVPATRVIYLIEDDEQGEPVAIAHERVEGNPDVLAAVEEHIKERTGRDDIRPDVRMEPPVDQPAVDESA